MMKMHTQSKRTLWRGAFFILFLVAPVLDIFRLDLTQGHFIILGLDWELGVRGVSASEATWNIILRVFLPLAALVATVVWVSWRWGRLYCGWLCPHFSVVEMINDVMRRASGKTTLWMRATLPENQADGTENRPRAHWWPITALLVLFFAALWAVTLLTYLLPPAEIWGNLFSGQLTRNQALFIGIATVLLSIEFAFARHLFCRFGCAIGLAQSLVWMANPRAMVVGYDRRSALACASCDASCEHACPMRLRPRRIKRKMFTCTQCQQCVQACERVGQNNGHASLLKMVEGDAALQVSRRDFGYHPPETSDSFAARGEAANVAEPVKWVG